jgi:hypothetical protein
MKPRFESLPEPRGKWVSRLSTKVNERARSRAWDRAEGLVLVIVILAVLGGIAWYLYSSRRNSEKEAWAYAREVAEHIALQRDARFIDLNLSSQAQVEMPPSFRERMLTKLGELGVPDKRMNITGHVTFSSYVFEPHGSFRAEINTPMTPVYLDMSISPSHGPWQIDALNLTWNPAF